MKINKRSKSSLFLMELIIVLMFFALSAAICMKVFSSAKVKTDMSRNMTNASFAAESLAETWKASKLDGTEFTSIYPNVTEHDGVITVFYDKDWTLEEKYQGAYHATIEEHADEYYVQAHVAVYDESGALLFDMVTAVSPDKEVE